MFFYTVEREETIVAPGFQFAASFVLACRHKPSTSLISQVV
jgi:hypothetical protein